MTTSTDRRVRPIARVVEGVRTLEGGGFWVRRPFPTASVSMLDPFLLLDEMGPNEVAPGEAVGAPDHPHRGFETVTYLLEGESEHRDSAGNHGVMRPGDVQWMTAGAGVVHSEMPSRGLQETGGRMHGFQLWVNLPAEHKMRAPRYQDLRAEQIPHVTFPGGEATVIAGDAFGVRGPAETHVPITYVHVRLDPGSTAQLALSPSANAFTWVFGGTLRDPDGGEIPEGRAVFYGTGDTVELHAGDTGLEALVLAGEPLREPVVRYGPFVMNTKAEIAQAFDDYESGAMGRIAARPA